MYACENKKRQRVIEKEKRGVPETEKKRRVVK